MYSDKPNRTTSTTSCARGCRSTHECPVWRQVTQADESSSETTNLEAVVQSCDGCMQKLAQAESNGLPWWEDARSSWLESELPDSVNNGSSFVTIEVQTEPLEEDAIDVQRVSVEFLSPAVHPELLGRIGRYDVERVIGVGGMGIVLKAFDSELHRVVAIKVLAEHLANNSSARKRFAREAQAAAAVVHANVIPIFNVETDGKHPYLVMQCVSGGSLQAKVDAHGPLSVAEALRIVKQTAAGLFAAHQQGLVHRDVKPANILLEENVDRVLLSDFGLARAVDDASFTRTGVIVGTPHYMSPEQANGDTVQCASDQFSLGSVIYFMLTGHPPFRAQTAMGVLNRICHSNQRPLTEINSNIPLEVSQLVDRLMDKVPSKRFGSAEEIEQEVDRLLSALQSGKLRLLCPPARQVANFSSRTMQVCFVCTMLVLAGLSFAVWQSRGDDDSTKLDRKHEFVQRNESISGHELDDAKQQLRRLEEEDVEFRDGLYWAQCNAATLESHLDHASAYPNNDGQFDIQVEALRLQINATRSKWSE